MDLSGRVHCPNGVNVCRNGIESCHKHRPLSRTTRLRPPVRDGPVFMFRWGSDSVKYAKPHIPYDQQVALLRSRGLAVEDPERAVQDLKRIGYYRLSGYLYPFRRIDPERQATGKRTRPQRLDSFVDGASLEDGVRLHDFDHRLAQVLLDGIQQIEIGLRVKIVRSGQTWPIRSPGHRGARASGSSRASAHCWSESLRRVAPRVRRSAS